MPYKTSPCCPGCSKAVPCQPVRATMVNGKIDPGDMLTYCTVSPCGEITPCCLIDPRCSPCYPNCGRAAPKDKCDFEQEFRMIMNHGNSQIAQGQDSICCCIPKPCLDTCPCCINSPFCKVYRHSKCKCLAFCEPGSSCKPKPCCNPDPCCKPDPCCRFDPCCKCDACYNPDPCCKFDPCCIPSPYCKPSPCCKPDPCCKSRRSCKPKPCCNPTPCFSPKQSYGGKCPTSKACSEREPFYNSNLACSQSPRSKSDIYKQYKSQQDISAICEKYKLPQKPSCPCDNISGFPEKYQSPISNLQISPKSPKPERRISDIKDPTVSRCDLLIKSIDEKLTKTNPTDITQSNGGPRKSSPSMHKRPLENNTMPATYGSPELIGRCDSLLKRLDDILTNPDRNTIQQIKECVCLKTPVTYTPISKTQSRSGLCNSGSKQICNNSYKSPCQPKVSTTSCCPESSCTYCPCTFPKQNTVNDKFYINYLHNNTFQRSKTDL